ncbi:MAG: cupin domain-containing protein [Bacteroidota bacterium]
MSEEGNAIYWIEKLGLQKHPEGGYYKENYKSDEYYQSTYLPQRYGGDRSFSTGIYFLITSDDFSSLHKIASDEMWHFYSGSPLTIYAFNDNHYFEIQLGSNFDAGQVFQAVVPAGYWFGSRTQEPNSYSLVGCTVAPGFDFDDFELAKRTSLQKSFPQHKKLIEQLTRS